MRAWAAGPGRLAAQADAQQLLGVVEVGQALADLVDDIPVITGPPTNAGAYFQLAPPLPPEEMERQLAFERRFDEANSPTPYAVSWWDDRSWRVWCWLSVYVVAVIGDLVLLIPAALGH